MRSRTLVVLTFLALCLGFWGLHSIDLPKTARADNLYAGTGDVIFDHNFDSYDLKIVDPLVTYTDGTFSLMFNWKADLQMREGVRLNTGVIVDILDSDGTVNKTIYGKSERFTMLKTCSSETCDNTNCSQRYCQVYSGDIAHDFQTANRADYRVRCRGAEGTCLCSDPNSPCGGSGEGYGAMCVCPITPKSTSVAIPKFSMTAEQTVRIRLLPTTYDSYTRDNTWSMKYIGVEP